MLVELYSTLIVPANDECAFTSELRLQTSAVGNSITIVCRTADRVMMISLCQGKLSFKYIVKIAKNFKGKSYNILDILNENNQLTKSLNKLLLAIFGHRQI